MVNQHPLIRLATRSDVLAKSRFVETAQRMEVSELSELYRIGLENAPKRWERKKRYFVGHDGVPSTTKPTSRLEEHLAIALWNEFHDRPLETPLGDLRLLDYQVPLKAKQDDHGVGKVDLLGIGTEGRLCLLELKVGGKSPDNPLRATIEALAYCAMVQANLSDFAAEVQTTFGLTTSEVPPRLLVIAPTDYWDSFRGNRATADWESAMQDLAGKIKQATEVDVDFLELEGFDFTVGHEGSKPQITTVGVCRKAV